MAHIKQLVALILINFFLVVNSFAGLEDGLVAYYPFDGNANDMSGNGNDGTVHGAQYTDQGAVNGAYSFDGLDDYIGLGARPSLELHESYSLATWIYIEDPNDAVLGQWRSIIRYGSGGGWYDAYYNLSYEVNESNLSFNYVSVYWEQPWFYAISGQKWHHVAVTLEGTTSRMYINGSFAGIHEFDATPADYLAGAEGYIGGLASTGHTDSFKGKIDEVRIYNRALTAAEVEELASAYSPPSETGAVQFASAEYTVGESGPAVEIGVARTGGSDGAASVDYATANGSAIAGSDYVQTGGTLEWTDGDSSTKTFQVPIVDDSYYERDETFTVVLSSASGVALGSGAETIVKIEENDVRPSDAWDGGDENPPEQELAAARSDMDRQHGPHYLSSDDTCDWFNLYLWKNREYTIWSTGDDDVQAELYSDTNATQLVASDDDSGGGGQFQIDFTPTESGNYYLRVSSSPSGVNAEYELHYQGGLDTWYYEARDLGANWAWLEWFGIFNMADTEFIRHFHHGWMFPFSNDPDSMLFWDSDMDAIWWTSRSGYPYVYRFSDGAWLWYQKGTKEPRWFINLNTMQWEEW